MTWADVAWVFLEVGPINEAIVNCLVPNRAFHKPITLYYYIIIFANWRFVVSILELRMQRQPVLGPMWITKQSDHLCHGFNFVRRHHALILISKAEIDYELNVNL